MTAAMQTWEWQKGEILRALWVENKLRHCISLNCSQGFLSAHCVHVRLEVAIHVKCFSHTCLSFFCEAVVPRASESSCTTMLLNNKKDWATDWGLSFISGALHTQSRFDDRLVNHVHWATACNWFECFIIRHLCAVVHQSEGTLNYYQVKVSPSNTQHSYSQRQYWSLWEQTRKGSAV